MRVTILSLFAASAFASPLYKRQSEILSSVTEVISSAVETATGAASSILEPTSVISSAIESAQESESPEPSASASGTGYENEAYPCPEGQFLVYVEDQENVQAPLDQVILSTGFFGTSSLFEITGTEGDANTEGQTRTISIEGTEAQEVLTNYTINEETDAVYLTWNGTEAVTINGLDVGAYSTVQQVYTNDTETSEEEPVTTIKLFSNICASDYDTAQTFFSDFFASALTNGTTAVQDGGDEESSPSASAVESVQSIVSSATEEIASATSSAVQEVSSGVESSAPVPSSAPGSGGQPVIDSVPSLVQCRPAALTYSGGQGPYFLSVLPGGETGATPLLQFPEQPESGSFTWVVNIAAGTSITLSIRDSTGAVNYSDQIQIQESPDTSCLAAQPSA